MGFFCFKGMYFVKKGRNPTDDGNIMLRIPVFVTGVKRLVC